MAAMGPGGRFERFEYELGPIGANEVEVEVHTCGICHSDLSMLDNEWGMTAYPFVGGHEVSGVVSGVGAGVRHLRAGDRVGAGWFSGSCMTCRVCLGGDHNLCGAKEQLIVGRHGGFATRVRLDAAWATPIPEGVDASTAGPLFCGGITVFNPIVQLGVRPTDRVGVIGIGGLGHLAVMFLNKWGCEVTAFTSSGAKMREAIGLGAHRCVDSRDAGAIAAEAGRLDVILSTVNVPLNWEAYMGALRPRGRLHHVGAVLEPMAVGAFTLIGGQKSVSGSPLGSPATTRDMLEFCARHGIAPVTETFPMSRINEAFDRLRSGGARYRVVLANDL